MSLDAEQRSRLLHAKIRGLVLASEAFGLEPDSARPVPFAGGAALMTPDSAWVLLDERAPRMLGGVLAWADQRDVGQVHVLTEDAAGELARRARCFGRTIAVWQVAGATLTRAEPAPIPEVVPPPEQALDLVGTLRDAALDIVIEHGEVRGEIAGLEVARVVVRDGDARIEVGVGRNDREAFAMVHGDVPTADALASVVSQVRQHRRAGDLTHPLARLAPERWLRSTLVREPDLVGARRLEAIEPTLPRENLKDPSPAIALGAMTDGDEVVVACSVGVDLDLVPAAADARLAAAPRARLVLAVPERDAHPVTRRLAAALAEPAEIVTVPDDFRR